MSILGIEAKDSFVSKAFFNFLIVLDLSKRCQVIYAKSGLLKFLQDYLQNRSSDLDHSLNHVDTKTKAVCTLHGEDELSFYLDQQREYVGLTRTIPFPAIHYNIVGSYNGVFCLETEEGLILWNPSIRRKLSVPESRIRYIDHHAIGFGFDPISDDYKIVHITDAKDIAFVYALKTGAWCKTASSKPEYTYVLSFKAYFFDGVLYWEVRHLVEPKDTYLLTFDLSTNVFGMIPLPGVTWHWTSTAATTIQGCLALVCYGYVLDDSWVWVWKDASWSMVYKLNINHTIVTKALQLQSQSQSTTNGDLLLYLHEDGTFIYNPTTRMLSKVVDFSANSGIRSFHLYVETLYLLDIGETV
ncbi:hypothetical protein LXL04_008745 [Taraxacum kok-saghyz]